MHRDLQIPKLIQMAFSCDRHFFLGQFQCVRTLRCDRRCERGEENVLRKINEQFCIKVHNIITSSNFLIYEGKSFSTAAHIIKWNEWRFFYCFTASASASSTSASLSRPNNLQLVSTHNNNNSERDSLVEETEHSFTHTYTQTHGKQREWARVQTKSFPIEIETFLGNCRPRPWCVCQFPSFFELLVNKKYRFSLLHSF